MKLHLKCEMTQQEKLTSTFDLQYLYRKTYLIFREDKKTLMKILMNKTIKYKYRLY